MWKKKETAQASKTIGQPMPAMKAIKAEVEPQDSEIEQENEEEQVRTKTMLELPLKQVKIERDEDGVLCENLTLTESIDLLHAKIDKIEAMVNKLCSD